MFEAWAAAIGAVGAIAGGAIAANGAKSAANTQASAAENAQQISENEFNTITGQEQPFMNAGYGALTSLNQGLGTAPDNGSGGYGSLTQPFNAQNFKDLSPAYQFQLQQGQQGVLNQDASGQGALSGATMKDLIGYNQNYANTSFNNAFNQYQTQTGNIYSRLSGIAQMGQNAASNTGEQGTTLAGQAAGAASAAGSYQAAGTIGAASALSGSLSSLSSMPWLYGNQSPGIGNYNPSSSNSGGFSGFAASTGYDADTGGYTP